MIKFTFGNEKNSKVKLKRLLFCMIFIPLTLADYDNYKIASD